MHMQVSILYDVMACVYMCLCVYIQEHNTYIACEHHLGLFGIFLCQAKGPKHRACTTSKTFPKFIEYPIVVSMQLLVFLWSTMDS